MDKIEWKLVSVEPTEGMREAGAVRAGTFYDSLPCSVYKAMLAAAPTPPAQEAEPVDRAKIRDTIQELAWDVFNNRLHPIEIAERVDALYPQNLADNDKLRQAADKAEASLEALLYVSEEGITCDELRNGIQSIRGNLRAALEGKS